MSAPDLATLTGVRSGKRSYYRDYVRSDERLRDAVMAMDSISKALVSTVHGPRGLLEEVVRAAGRHLQADWVLLALGDGELPGARPRFVAMGPDGSFFADPGELPEQAGRELRSIQSGRVNGVEPGWVRVPMRLADRPVGSLAARHRLGGEPEGSDLSVLRILANQAAVSLHTSEQYSESLELYRLAQQLHAEVDARRSDLVARTSELRETQEHLVLARQRELVDAERHRIARELHDGVSQIVLSAGLSVQLARGDLADGAGPGTLMAHLDRAKALTTTAVDQLRRAIYALEQPQHQRLASLPALLRTVAAQHENRFDVSVRVCGPVRRLPDDGDHEVVRCVGEAMYNVASHARAGRVLIRVSYRPAALMLGVSDDGVGDPAELERLLQLEREAASDGRHRGLALIENRLAALGGSLAFRRSKLGGVRVEMRIPLTENRSRPQGR